MAEPGEDVPIADDDQRAKLRDEAIRRLREFLEELQELRSTSPLGEHATVNLHDVGQYNDALTMLRQAGEKISARYDVTGPIIPAGANESQMEDGIPLHALRGKARTVLQLVDAPPSDSGRQ